jgi:hypothetical protein
MKILLGCLCFLWELTAYGQDPNEMLKDYSKVDHISALIHQKHFAEAHMEYLSINRAELLSPYQCFFFADAFIKVNDTVLCTKLLNRAFAKGATWEWLESYKDVKRILTKADSLYYSNTIKEARCKLDINLYCQLGAMLDTEQFIRRKWLKTRDTVYLRAMKELDSMNAIAIFKIIDEHGWLGYNTYQLEEKLMPIFLHITSQSLDSVQFQQYRKKIFEEVLRGEMQPATYAVWVDRYYKFNLNKPEVYGTFWSQTDAGKELLQGVENPEKIDEIRAAIGLSTLEDYMEVNEKSIRPSWYKKK